MLNEYEQKLLSGWEDVHKNSQLTLWLLLAIKHSPKQMQEIKEFIEDRTTGKITADQKSIYRALRRLSEADLIASDSVKSPNGPNTKLYKLTSIGSSVLAEFLQSNIKNVFLSPKNKDILG